MRKNSINNVILIIGLVVVAATPLSVMLFSSELATAMCVNQDLESEVVCTPNVVVAFLITLSIPIVVGSVLIVISALARRK